MRFGIQYNVDYQPEVHGTPSEYYETILNQVVHAEKLGYASAWFGEHHYEKFSFGMPSLMIAAAASRTSTIKLGTGVAVLPLHHPIRLAEEYAMLDNLTNGRLEWGVGRGFLKYAYDIFGVSDDESVARYRESLGIVLDAWNTDGPINHKSDFWDVRDYEVFPKPLQKPLPIYAAAASTPASYVWTGQQGLNLGTALFLPQKDMVRDGIRAYREELVKQGIDPKDREVLSVMQMYCGQDQADVLRGWGYTANYLEFFSSIDAKSPHRSKDYVAYQGEKPPLADIPFELFDKENLALIGTPERIVEKLHWIQEFYEAPDIMLLEVSHGGIPPELATQTLELFASEVMPHFK